MGNRISRRRHKDEAGMKRHDDTQQYIRSTIGEAFVVNPVRPLKRGAVTPFIPMDALSENGRAIERHESRKFTGSGTRFRNGDTLIARITPCLENGKTAFVCDLPEGVIAHGSTEYIVLSAREGITDPLFGYYLARTPEFRRYAIGHMEGTSGRQRVPASAIENYEIHLPPIDTQRSISRTLGALDDKIELNRRTSQTLEAIAQAIFKSWFVDFDPVKAKIAALEQGEDPLRAAIRTISGKTDDELDQLPREQYDELAATTELFPDAMKESVLGEIPEGWKASPLDQVANYMNGLALQKFPAEDSSDYLPVIKIAQLKAGNTTGSGRASTNIRPEYVIKNGDVLFSWSGSLEVDVWTAGAGALNQHLFKVTSSTTPKWFYLYATKHHLPWFREIAATKATTMGHIQRKHLANALIAVPPNDLMKISSGIISPLLEKHIFLRTQEKDLHKIRDHLLPKLLSGYLVDTAERNTTT